MTLSQLAHLLSDLVSAAQPQATVAFHPDGIAACNFPMLSVTGTAGDLGHVKALMSALGQNGLENCIFITRNVASTTPRVEFVDTYLLEAS